MNTIGRFILIYTSSVSRPPRPHIVPSASLAKFGLPAEFPHAIPIPVGHYAEHAAPAGSMLLPQEIYHGSKVVKDAPLKLRIANGAAGQSGLIRELARVFIDYCTKQLNYAPFTVCSYF